MPERPLQKICYVEDDDDIQRVARLALERPVAGQLVEMFETAPGDALGCLTCHAPLAEQRPLVREPGGHVTNPAFDPALQSRGLVCAGCHVRAHERFGPPRRDGS